MTKRYPARCINTACAQALEQSIYSYKRVLALTDLAFTEALNALDQAPSSVPADRHQTAPNALNLAQRHELIRQGDEYADLFAHAATLASATYLQAGQA